jgi:thiol:disulfide interchange protein DsbD
MRYLLFTLLSIFGLSVQAQIFEPVEIETSQVTLPNGNIRLIVTTTIEDGWHIYGTDIDMPDVPLATGLQIDADDKVTLVGGVVESKPMSKYDDMFGMDLTYHENSATFYQDIKFNGDKQVVNGVFMYTSCDDSKCLPAEELKVKWTLKKGLQNAKALGGINVGGIVAEQEETDGIYEPIVWSFDFKENENGSVTLKAHAELDEGWHLYATKLDSEDGPIPTSFILDSGMVALGELQESETHTAFDPNFQLDIAFHEQGADFSWDIQPNSNGVASGVVEFMVCDNERCLPPEVVKFSNVAENSVASAVGDIDQALIIDGLDIKKPKKDCGINTAITQEKKSNWGIFLLGFVGGLIALLTPCVFPMIPLTVSFFTKGGTDKGGKWQSILYGGFIVAIYLLLSTPFYFLDSINPEILNTISTNVYLNVSFFVIFVIFAISFFGYFEITMPAKLTNKIDSASNVGGIIGIFFMALTLSLVSFSCTGPILGSLLAGSLSADGGAIQLSAGMGGFGLALAFPFALFAAFPSVMKKLPQSGSWLTSVKVVLGFVELALAIKFLSNADLVEHWGFLKREIFFGAWIVIGIGLILYLFGKIKFPHDSPIAKLSAGRKLLGGAAIVFVLYLIPGLTNTEYANRRLLSGFPPPLFYSLYQQESDCPLGLECYKDYNEGLAVAKAANKPVLLDFTGWACVNCRKMEENVWVEDAVYKTLKEEVVLISLYVDDRKELPLDEQFEYTNPKGRVKDIVTVGNKWSTFQTVNFVNNSQPFYVLISPDGELLTPPVGNTPDAEEYLRFLECGISAFKDAN